jgi:acetoin utilization protein AcuB
VDESGELVGILSDRDLRTLSISYFASDELVTPRLALDERVASIMSTTVLSVDLDADAAEIVDLMLDHKIGAVPVVDEAGLLVGIIRYIDVLRALPIDVAAE